MSSKIYEEAIAEAKQLREVAEQNAKNAIIEAVTPKIREFIDNQLMGSGDNKSVESQTAEDIIAESVGINTSSGDSSLSLDETALSTLAGLMGKNGKKSEILSALAESINSLDKKDAKLVISAAKKLKGNAESFNSNVINNDVSKLQENSKMRSNDKIYEVDLRLLKEEVAQASREEQDVHDDMFESDDPEEEAGLREMLRSLGVLNEDKIEIDLGDEVELDPEIQIVARLLVDDDEEDGDLEIEDEVMDIDMGDEELEVEDEVESLDEVFDIDPIVLKEELKRIRKIVREAKSLADEKGGADAKEASWGGKGHANAGLKGGEWGGKGSGKGGNAFGGGSEKGDIYKVKLNSLKETLRKEQRKNRALMTRLSEYRGAVETLREQLTDLNLFNAKLLYVNKLFQDKSITPGKRRSMMESIDSAKSLREVKLIYKTLTSSPTNKKSRRLNESSARTLGSSSRAVGKSSATVASNEVDRWAILAGIK
jgi:hypothetical protein